MGHPAFSLTERIYIDKKIDTSYYAKLDQHKKEVFSILSKVIIDMAEKAVLHDNSKHHPIEKKIFKSNIKYKFGSPEYNKNLDSLKEGLNHHYGKNRHHPEHFKNGVNGMNLLDVMEMVADWIAASNHYQVDGNIYESFEKCKERFGIDDQLGEIILNTIKYIVK